MTAVDVAAARAEVAALWDAGRYMEALRALDRHLQRVDDPALHADGATLRAEMFDAPRAAEHARRAHALAPDDASLALRLAAVLIRLDRRDEGRALTEAALASHPDPTRSLRRDVADLLREAGALEAADAHYAALPGDPVAIAWRGAFSLWRGDLDAAEDFAQRALAAGDGATALSLRGAAMVLRGDLPGALATLARAVALRPDDATAAVWLGDALRRSGRVAEALAETRRGGERGDDLGEHVAAQLVIHLASLQRGEFLGVPDATLAAALATLSAQAAPPETAPPTPPLPDDLRPPWRRRAVALEDALTRLRGNRSATPSYVRADGALEALITPRSPRVEAKRALWRFVASGDPDEALRVFDDIHARWPDTPEPYNYRGELYLYLGDPATARAQFEQALARYRQSRWAYIGLGGAAVLEGNYEEALRVLAEGVTRGGGEGPTTFVYRGEALRCLGRVEAARRDLTHAVTTTPARVGAWVNLALLELEAGDLGAHAKVFEALTRRAPGFVRDAGEGPPAVVLRRMLAMLRGNRGASCVTYFTADGVLRSVRPFKG
ncbi:MAG: tetratricopeptide repeat protein [Polyangiales bacterium]